MVRVGICDDEHDELDRLSGLVGGYFEKRRLPYALSAFSSGDGIVAAMATGFDLVFLDIYIGLGDGIEVARRIRELDRSCVIVFATNSSSHALRGYGVRALQYLLKPIDAARLDDTLDLAMEELAARRGRYVRIDNRQGSYRVELGDLVFAESDARVLTVHTRTQGDIRYYERLDELDALCDDSRFLRCHKSFLVNLDYVQAIVGDKVRLEGGRELPVSIGLSEAKAAFAARAAGSAGFGASRGPAVETAG